MSRFFIYTPRSGGRIFINRLHDQTVVLPNGSYEVTGDDLVRLEVYTSNPGRDYCRDGVRRLLGELARTVGGFDFLAYDSQGIIGVIAPPRVMVILGAVIARLYPQLREGLAWAVLADVTALGGELEYRDGELIAEVFGTSVKIGGESQPPPQAPKRVRWRLVGDTVEIRT